MLDPDSLVDRMDLWITDYKTNGKRNPVVLTVHPFTAAYLTRKVPTYPTRWFMKHLIRIRLEVNPEMDPMSYRFEDARSGEDLTERITLPKTAAQERQGAEVG